MDPRQIIFIAMFLLVLAYLCLRVFSWAIRNLDWAAAALDWVFAPRRGYHLVRMEPVNPVPFDSSDLRRRDIPSSDDEQTEQTDDADSRQTAVCPLYDAVDRLQLDRTRTALIEVLVLAGWEVGEVRGVVKGDNGKIGDEVAAARERLGGDAPAARTFVAREHRNGELIERDIPFDEPVTF